jgi:DNA-binding MarR family transcriptional regulator
MSELQEMQGMTKTTLTPHIKEFVKKHEKFKNKEIRKYILVYTI